MRKEKSVRHFFVTSFWLGLTALAMGALGGCNATGNGFDSLDSLDGGTPSGQYTGGGSDASNGATDSAVQAVLEQTNAYRASNGLGALTLNAQLAQAAQGFAEAMGTEGFFSHTSPDGSTPSDRITRAGYAWKTWGENIAYGYATADQVMQGWINSAGHRANILGSGFKEIGIGYAVVNGTAYWVQDFGAR
jgi:uncharacterized protein YkwD